MRWKAKAREYQQKLEARDLLITEPTVIRRVVALRWGAISGDRRIPHSSEMECILGRRRVAHYARNLRKNGIKKITIIRLWMVCTVQTVGNESRLFLRKRWRHLVMAQAQRDARNFHYARWLMTKDTVT